MEGTMTPITALAGLLSRVVQEECPSVTLLISAVERQKIKQAFEVAHPLAEQLKHRAKDVCCFSLYRTSPNSWKLLTTHGNVVVSEKDGVFKTTACSDQREPRKGHTIRNRLLGQWSTAYKKMGFRYPTVKGNVLFCGDFSLLHPAALIGLQMLFTINGAAKVAFATPVIDGENHRVLEQQGCKIIMLRPVGEAFSLSA
ncbi:MAG: hypothetical protein WC845_03200 [Candidatus Staskawiczbacteria bacterium]|jgi:hypothetical protein